MGHDWFVVVNSMASPFDTISLDAETWDVAVVGGSFVVIKDAFAVAQDMQSAIRLVQGEYIYNSLAGVPYLSIFGQTTSLPVLKADIAGSAATIPGTSNVVCFIEAVQDRLVSGQVQANVALPNGRVATIAASISPPNTTTVLVSDDGQFILTDDNGTVLTP